MNKQKLHIWAFGDAYVGTDLKQGCDQYGPLGWYRPAEPVFELAKPFQLR